MSGPNAALATKGNADTTRPSAIDTATGPRTVPSMATLRQM
jgi:hypothetical protein